MKGLKLHGATSRGESFLSKTLTTVKTGGVYYGKKGSRSVQPSSKGLTTDSKKTQDVNKLWPRGGRRREPNGNTSSKNEISRKPNSQRNKAIDKRPRPRGSYYSGAVGGKEDTRLEVEEAELGSVFIQGSKKQSLNHLLNFHFEPREGHGHSNAIHSKSGHRFVSSLKHKYNKEQFLQANCQFIVCENGDYKMYMSNPDALVNWDLIEQINIHVLDFPSCPICLYPPVAAKMTKCGHIYCWSCILHYLSLSDKSWRKCPICYEAIDQKDLKSVIAVAHKTFNLNETITFKLMKRLRGSLTAYPIELQIPENNTSLHMSYEFDGSIYSKLLLAGKNEIKSIIEREEMELLRQLVEDDDCPEKCFIENALTLLHERQNALFSTDDKKELFVDPLNEIQPDLTAFPQYSVTNKKEHLPHESNNRKRYESSSSDTISVETDANVNKEFVVGENINQGCNTQQNSKYFYFYQASDGQHIYLHSLNVHMLEHTYGSLELCPTTIRGCIVEKESSSITEDLRRRVRYLQHLPLTCQFEVAEIQLRAPTVTKETLECFSDQIENRKKRRQRRARDEKRREKRITEEENRKMGKYASANIHIDSHHQFPDFQTDIVHTIPTSSVIDKYSTKCEESISSSNLTSTNQIVSASESLNSENEYSGLSFAKMLSSNKSSTSVWPVRKSEPIKVPSVASTSTRTVENESDVEGYVPVPAFNRSFGDAIALALEKAALDNDIEEGIKSNGKKKKNKQKKILFTTTMACSSK